VLELPDLDELVGVLEGDGDDDDDASLTFEDLMGMSDSTFGDSNVNFTKKKYNNASCDTISENEAASTRVTNIMKKTASCPDLELFGTQFSQKKKNIKMEPKASHAPPRTASALGSQPAKSRRSRIAPQSLSLHSRSLNILNSSTSLFRRVDLNENERRKRRGSSINAYPVEFGGSFSSLAHSSGLRKKLHGNNKHQQPFDKEPTFEEVLEMLAKWNRQQKREEKRNSNSMRSFRSVEPESSMGLTGDKKPIKDRAGPPRGSKQGRDLKKSPMSPSSKLGVGDEAKKKKKTKKSSKRARRSGLALLPADIRATEARLSTSYSNKKSKDLDEYWLEAFKRNLTSRCPIEKREVIVSFPS
jgi:hypothetical protein